MEFNREQFGQKLLEHKGLLASFFPLQCYLYEYY